MDKPHFIVVEPEVCQSLGVPFIIMLADVGFWVEHYDALEEWCEQHNCQALGMTVELFDAKTLTAFALRWT